jgi:hypothetical protein
MQAIQTRYLSATDHHGTRVKAWTLGGSIILPWDYEAETLGNHKAAAVALQSKLGWAIYGRLHTGVIPSGDYVHVFAELV